MAWTKEQLRQKRRALGIPERDPFSAPRFIAMGEELKRLMDLPWPRNLFSQQVAMSQQLQQQKPRNDALCICGKEHRQLWPRTTRSQYGYGFNVTFYCSDACKSKTAREESR